MALMSILDLALCLLQVPAIWCETPSVYLATNDLSACATTTTDARALALANDNCYLEEEGEEDVIDEIVSAMADGEDAIASIVANDPMIIDEHTPAAIVAKLCNIECSLSDDCYDAGVQFARTAAIQVRELASGADTLPAKFAKLAKLNPVAPAWMPPVSPSSMPSAKSPTKPNKVLYCCCSRSLSPSALSLCV
ncbi:hypothetical protein MPSEU_000025100 [Mayamaea pseudoterrestris]|nr:hypothetical protein MPSEU_000025100 [Mayamaea pseudoterrestris]